MATDIPEVNSDLLSKLIQSRNRTKIATAFQGLSKSYAEPLICIWEPKALESFQNNFQKTIFKIQNILRNNPIEIVQVQDYVIQNINTPQEKMDYKGDKNL